MGTDASLSFHSIQSACLNPEKNRPHPMKILLPMLLLGLGQPASLLAETWQGTAAISFAGTSTLHDWSGKVDAAPFATEVTMRNGKPRRVAAKVIVKAAEMDTAEPRRDANMLEAMKAGTYPLITAKIDADFSSIATAGAAPTLLPMELTLLGRPQKVEGKISNWQVNGGQATFDLDFPVSMKTSGISVPAVLVFIRVGDGVKVHASVKLEHN